MHSNVTMKNVSWPHFSWATLYIVSVCICHMESNKLTYLLSNIIYQDMKC